MLQLTGVEAGYDLLQVLWGVDLHVDEGEFVALLGPNGAGKTTTLRTIAGFLPPIRGSVMFRGAHLDGVSPHRVSTTGVGYVSESLNLFPAMSVYENLLVGAYAVRDKATISSTMDLVFELFPRLLERRDQLAGTLSGGERKMLAIGRGLMPSPSLLLVDEPSLGLAPMATLTTFEALKALHATRRDDPARRAEREHHAPPGGSGICAGAGADRARGDRAGAARQQPRPGSLPGDLSEP